MHHNLKFTLPVNIEIFILKLTLQTYMKFIGVPVRVKEANNPFFTPKGTLPVMRDGRKVLTNFEEVVDHLKSLVSQCCRFS